MSTKQTLPKSPRAPAPARAVPANGYSDDTGQRILAFLLSMRPLSGMDYTDDKSFQRGSSLIAHLALGSRGTDHPSILLTINQCADVLNFLAHVEPIKPQNWWKDPENAPSHTTGLKFVLEALEESLRRRCAS